MIYAILFKGKVIKRTDVLKHDKKRSMYNKGPKKTYATLGAAKNGFHNLPDSMKIDCEIWEFGPVKKVEWK